MRQALCAVAVLALVFLGLAPMAVAVGPSDGSGTKPPDAIPVRVDPRVELVMIIFRLAGAGEFNMESSASPYSKAVDEYFDKHKDHHAVQAATRLRETHSITFSAVTEFAVRLKDWSSGEFCVPMEPLPAGMSRRWNTDIARELAAEVRDFARDSQFGTFLGQQRLFFDRSEAALAGLLASRPYRQLIEEYFGERLAEGSFAIPGLLAGGGNYGMSVTFPDGRLVVNPIIGVSSWGTDGTPKFEESDADTIVHEFCHPFVNPLVDLFAAELMPAASLLHERHQRVFAAQAYGEPRSVMYESLVRACVVQIMTRTGEPQRGLLQRRSEIARGFWLTPVLAGALDRYEAKRAEFPTLRSFMPEIVSTVRDTREILAAEGAKAPRIVSIEPKDGSVGLSPEVAFQLTFDRPMDKKSRGLSFDGGVTFERVVEGSFDDAGTTYRTVLRLPAGQKIRARLNAHGAGLVSVEGYACQPVEFEFTTAGPGSR